MFIRGMSERQFLMFDAACQATVAFLAWVALPTNLNFRRFCQLGGMT